MEIRVDKGKVKFVEVDENGQDQFFTKFGYLKGKCKWAKVLAPDQFGNYAVDMYPEAEVLEHFKEEIKALTDEAVTLLEGVKKKVALVADPTKEDEDEVEYIQFKRKSEKANGSLNTPPKIYDLYGNYQADWDKLVGNGSLVKVGYMLTPYYMASTKTVGVSYKFYAIQVIDHVAYESTGSGNSGFGDETGDGAPFESGDGEDF
jgi:hypothetical protein